MGFPRSIGTICHGLLLKAAIAPKNDTCKKRRVMFLYERGILSAGDVERAFQQHRLGAA